MCKAVFLDKDGTLIVNVAHNVDPGRIQWMAGALEGLTLLHQAGYRLLVISNQSGVAMGYFAEDALRNVEERLREMLAPAGLPLAGFYYCPHHPDGRLSKFARQCECRKPRPGLVQRAAADHRLRLDECWMVGDILNDVEAGRRAGCRTVLIDNGGETQWDLTHDRIPDYTAADLVGAARAIIRAGHSGARPAESHCEDRYE